MQRKQHEKILDLVTISFKQVKVEVTKMEDRQLKMNDRWLPHSCSIEARGCTMEETAQVIDPQRINFCPNAVRWSVLSQVTLKGRK